MQGLLVSIKKHIIFLFLLILLLFLLWLRIFVVPKANQEASLITPTQTIISITPPVQIVESDVIEITPAENIDSTQITYTYNGEVITLPQTLSVFTYETPVILTQENATKLASLFNMQEEPFIQGVDAYNYPYFTFKNNDETLILGGSFPTINYIKGNPEQALSTQNPFNDADLLTAAASEFERIGLTNIVTNNPDITYLKVTSYASSLGEYILEETSSIEEASYIKFTFPLTIGNFPLVSQDYKKEVAYIILDSQGNLYELFSFIIPPASSTVISTKPFSEIINTLNQNAIVLNASSRLDSNSEAPHTYSLTSVDLQNPQIHYFIPSSFSYNLNPFLLFNGVSTDDQSGETVNSLILVPIF